MTARGRVRASLGLLALLLGSACGTELPSDPDTARALAQELIANSYADLEEGRIAEGRGKAQRALRLFEHARAPSLERAEATAHLVWAALERGDLDAAAEGESTVARLCAEVEPGTEDARAYVLHLMGTLHHRHQRPAAARRWWQPALAELRAAPEPDPASIAWVGNDLADQLRQLGEIERAERLQLAIVDDARRDLPHDAFFAVLLNNLGAMYWDQERLDEAESLYREALEVSLADSTATAQRLAKAYLNLGVLQHDQLRTRVAEQNLDRAVELGREAYGPSDRERVWFLLERGRLADTLYDPEAAIAFWDEGLTVLAAQPGSVPVYESLLLHAIGRARLRRARDREPLMRAVGDFERAVSLRERALGADHPDVAEVLADLGAAQLAAGDPAAARVSSDRCLALLEARPLHRESRALALITRARLQRVADDPRAAFESYDAALREVERLRPRRGGGDRARADFFEHYVDWYGERVALGVELGEVEAAVVDVERMRARVLRDRLQRFDREPNAALPDSIRAVFTREERAAQAQISAAQREIAFLRTTWSPGDDHTATALARLEAQRDEAMLALEEVDARLEAHRARSGARRVAVDPSISELDHFRAHAIGHDEVALLYCVGGERSFVFLIPPREGTIVADELYAPTSNEGSAGSEPQPLTATALRDVIRRGRGADDATPRSATERDPLFDALVPPAIRAAVFAAGSVVILPDGDLHRLPFELLNVPDPERASQGVPWLEAGPVLRYAHSLGTLAASTGPSSGPAPSTDDVPSRDRVVVLCDPAFTDADLDTTQVTRWPALVRLPGTRDEARAIARAFAPDATTVLSGVAATESALRAWAPRARILHLATHGIVDERQDAMLAALALAAASGDGDDGFLHLFEVDELPLVGCELAVLSACDTQTGDRVRGEGVFALSRGFLVAGARRTVASLWPVSDRSTAVLMDAFYGEIARAEQSRSAVDYAVALRDAKLRVRSDPRWSAPYHWAPFVLTGAR